MAAPTLLISEVTESAQNITAEHLLFTATASGECMLCVQISFSSLNAAAASIYTRLEHTLADNTVLSYNQSMPIQTKFAAANTAFGLRLSDPVWLKNGEKLNVYALSTNASDTSVTYLAKVLDASSVLSANVTAVGGTVGTKIDLVDAPNATAVTAIQNGLATLTDASAKYAAIIAAISASEVTGYLGRCFSPTLQNELTKDGAGQIVVVPIFKLDPDFDSEHINPATTALVVWKGGAPIGVGAAAATVWGDIAVSAANPILLNVTIDADDLDTDGMVTIAIGMVDTNGKTALAMLISNVVDSTIATNIDSLVAVAPASVPQTKIEAEASFAAIDITDDIAALATTTQLTAAVAPLATAANLAVVDGVVDEILANTEVLMGGNGAVHFAYTVTDTAGSTPIQGVYVRVTSDLAGTTTIATGTTNANGIACDVYGHEYLGLPVGTAYFWRSKPSVAFTNPDIEVVTET